MTTRNQPLRIVVRRNKRRFGKVIVVRPDTSWEHFVEELVKKEIVPETSEDISLYLGSGDEVDDLDELRDSDVVYICRGTERPSIPKSEEITLANALNKLAIQLAKGGSSGAGGSVSAASGGDGSSATGGEKKKKKTKRQRTLKVYDVTISTGEFEGRKGTINARYAESEILKVYLEPLDGGDMSEIVSVPKTDVSINGEARKKVMERRRRPEGAEEGGSTPTEEKTEKEVEEVQS